MVVFLFVLEHDNRLKNRNSHRYIDLFGIKVEIIAHSYCVSDRVNLITFRDKDTECSNL